MNNINLHNIYPSNFIQESRILEERKSLVKSDLFDETFIRAIYENGLKEHEQFDIKREVWRIPLKTMALPNGDFWEIMKHIEWALKIFLD